jgi:hypothetical protein
MNKRKIKRGGTPKKTKRTVQKNSNVSTKKAFTFTVNKFILTEDTKIKYQTSILPQIQQLLNSNDLCEYDGKYNNNNNPLKKYNTINGSIFILLYTNITNQLIAFLKLNTFKDMEEKLGITNLFSHFDIDPTENINEYMYLSDICGIGDSRIKGKLSILLKSDEFLFYSNNFNIYLLVDEPKIISIYKRNKFIKKLDIDEKTVMYKNKIKV